MTRNTILWALVLSAPLLLVVVHFGWMWRQEQYHYLPALSLAFGLLFYARWDRHVAAPHTFLDFALIMTGLGVVLPVSIYFWSPWLAAFAWVLLIVVFVRSQRESETGQSLASLGWLALLILPLPMNLDNSLTAGLQLRSTAISSFLLDQLRVPHALFGNVIELVGGKLFVEEACSGVQSLYTVVFCSVLVAVIFRRSPWLIPLYIVAAALWAGVMNVLRITAIALAQEWCSVDLSHGWQHAALGYFCLATAILLLLSTDRMVRVFFFPTNPDRQSSKFINPLVRWWNAVFAVSSGSHTSSGQLDVGPTPRWFLAAVALALILFGSSAYCGILATLRPHTERAIASPFLTLDNQIELAERFKVLKYERIRGTINLPYGENGDLWSGLIGALPATIAINQPYPVWHDLTVCYQGIGWTLNDRDTLKLKSTEGEPWDCITVRYLSENGYAYLWFSAFNAQGGVVSTPSSSLLDRLEFNVSNRQHGGDSEGDVAIVQLFVESGSVLSSEVIDDLTAVHIQSRMSILNKIRESQK